MKSNLDKISLAKNIYLSRKPETMDHEKVLDIQEKRFRKLLKYVLKNSEFYREYYGDHGINLDNYKNVRIKDIPTIDKSMVMKNYDRLVCREELKKSELESFIGDASNKGKLFKGKYHVIHGSGSTGEMGIYVYSEREWAILQSIIIRRVIMGKLNFKRKIRFLFIGATDGNYAGVSLVRSSPKFLFDVLLVDINTPIEEIDKKVDIFKPDYIGGYSSGMYILAMAQLQGHINISPKKVICSGDPLTEDIRKLVLDAFGINPVNYYAASEAPAMAAQCSTCNKMHLFNDWHCFEVVDDGYNEVEIGQDGRLILTNLYNYTQPLIRYEMKDRLILGENKCSCSWKFPVIDKICGRQEEFMWFEKESGKEDYIHPSIFTEFFIPNLEKLQVVQQSRSKFLMRVKINGEREQVLADIKKRMNEILSNKGLTDFVDYEVEVVEDIKNDAKTGKYKLVIPLKN